MGKRKAPTNENNPNHDFCEFLTELAEYERNVSRNIYKYNAYRKAAITLAKHPVRITSGEEARKLDGIGDKIAKKIYEFIDTGKLQKLETIRSDDTSNAITLLTHVSGIGPAKAKQLVDMGITTIDDLYKHKDQLNHHQLVGLRYFEDFQKKIPREEIHECEKFMRKHIDKLDPSYVITICGSYRRGKSHSGDIDMLLTHPSFSSEDDPKSKTNLLHNVVEVLEAKNIIVDTISLGDVKFMGVCRAPGLDGGIARRLDIRLTPFDQYHCCVLYFTGSDVFNREMRAHALVKGFTLNEYSLRRIDAAGVPGKPVVISTEEDIFSIIHFPYKKPTERD